MYLPYIQLIKEMFPNAKIIIDPFHIVQALNRELNRTRVRVMNKHRYKDPKLYRKLKHYWKLILRILMNFRTINIIVISFLKAL